MEKLKYNKINWRHMPWAMIEAVVYNLQCAIYEASKINNVKQVHKLQKQLVRSEEAKLLAVRRITQDNRGKSTAGVDGIKSIKPENRYGLIKKLVLDGSTSAIRRVYIPKGNGKLRPLGIPTIKDRCKQMLLTMALEPQWEAKFENNVYGFRPGYSTADAKRAVTRQLQGQPKYFLDADIEGCFDNIGHVELLNKLETMSMFEQQIKAWLKAGIMDNLRVKNEVMSNEAGTPQGGVISPLLSNIALHGLETAVINQFSRDAVKVIRYADDFVITGKRLVDIEKAKEIVESFLATMKLNLSQSKTRIGNSMTPMEGDPTRKVGIDFLGYHFRNLATSKHRGVKSTKGVKQKFIQISSPTKESTKRHFNAIKRKLKKLRNAPAVAVIKHLTPIISGWTRYYSITKCTKYFAYMSKLTWGLLWKWAVTKHKSAKKAKEQCFNISGWKFCTHVKGKTYILKRHDQTLVRPYIKIKAGASIYSGELAYFSNRMSYHNARIRRLIALMKSQNFRCSECEEWFKPYDLIELHHELDNNNARTGKLRFMHRHCHDLVHGSNKS